MKLLLKRQWFTENTTCGLLFVDGVAQCYTLEDVARPEDVKIPGKTCILAGIYELVIDFSNRFQKMMPHILDVKMFSGIRFHPGNDEFDTEGCILVGVDHVPDNLIFSKMAFEALMVKLTAAVERGEKIELEIVNAQIR